MYLPMHLLDGFFLKPNLNILGCSRCFWKIDIVKSRNLLKYNTSPIFLVSYSYVLLYGRNLLKAINLFLCSSTDVLRTTFVYYYQIFDQYFDLENKFDQLQKYQWIAVMQTEIIITLVDDTDFNRLGVKGGKSQVRL